MIEDILPFVLNTKRPLSDIWLLRYKQNSFGCFREKSQFQFFPKKVSPPRSPTGTPPLPHTPPWLPPSSSSSELSVLPSRTSLSCYSAVFFLSISNNMMFTLGEASKVANRHFPPLAHCVSLKTLAFRLADARLTLLCCGILGK